MTKATDETQMVHLRLEQSLLKRLEDFRFRQRFPTRSAAIKWLLEWALSRKPVPVKGE
jgi:hypothetical protein